MEGYQNEAMEAYITPERGCSFSITLNPAWLGISQTNFTSVLTSTENVSEPLGIPVFATGYSGGYMRIYGNATNLSINTHESENPVTGSHDYMIIMTDH